VISKTYKTQARKINTYFYHKEALFVNSTRVTGELEDFPSLGYTGTDSTSVRRSKMKKLSLTFILFIVLSIVGMPSYAEEQRTGNSPCTQEVIEDVLWLRPIGFFWTLIAGATYGISYPVTRPLNKAEEAQDFLISDPYKFTFERPLGEM
jgi:hypothetical protein